MCIRDSPSTASNNNQIEFVTIASQGNTQDFGDMTDGRSNTCVSGNQTRAVSVGGATGTGNTNIIAWDDRWGTEEFEFTLEENDPPPPPPFEFTAINVNSVGAERGLVDMTGDGLDDLVSIQSSNVNLLVQTEGGFEEINISTDQADYTPSWSMASA